MQLQETFAPLMRFRNRRAPGTFVRLSLPDEIQQRHWIVFGPSGEGSFAETYRAQVEALVKDLAGDNPGVAAASTRRRTHVPTTSNQSPPLSMVLTFS